MKRKFSLFVAVIMILSLLPAMNVFAATENRIPVYAGTVSSDYDWGSGSAVVKAPVLDIKNDGPGTFKAGTKFLVTLRNSKWSLDAFNKTPYTNWPGGGTFYNKIGMMSSGGGFTQAPNGGTINVGGTNVSPGENGMLYVMANQPVSGLGSSGQYVINFISDNEAEVTLGSDMAVTGQRVYVPLIAKMSGTGQATVEVSDINAGVSASAPYNFANGGDGDVTITSADPNKDTAKNLNLDAIKITETVAATIEFDANREIELTAPVGFDWDVSSSGLSKVKVNLYGGFNTTQTTFTNGTTPGLIFAGPNDDQILNVDLSKLAGADSTTTSGNISITGLVLVKNDDAELGDINVRVEVTDAGSATIKVGALTKRNVTLTVEDKTLPEIVSGVYTHDAKHSGGQVLDFTIKETVKGAWAAGQTDERQLVLTLNDGAKFRAVKVEKASGFKPGVANQTVFLDTERYSSSDSKKTSSGVTVELKDDKFMITDADRTGDDLFELKLRAYVTVKPGYTGDITVSTHEDNDAFGAALSGVVAKAIDPFTVSSEANAVGIGYMGLKLSDITIKENKAGAIKKMDNETYMRTGNEFDKNDAKVLGESEAFGRLRLWLGTSNSAHFNADTAKVEVLSGDILIDSIKTTDTDNKGAYRYDAGDLVIAVKRASSTPSTIKITGLTLDTDRALPAGKIDLRVGGSAAANYAVKDRDYGAFDVNYFVGVKGYLDITTAPPDNTGTYTTSIAAKVGQSTLQVGEKTITMDVAPYNQNGSVMVPVRAVVEALGMASYQVNWYAPSKTVSIAEPNGKVSQFRIGENYVTVGGVNIPFTGAPATLKNNRAFLPFRALGEIVLGCPVEWDQATQTAYFNRAKETTTVRPASEAGSTETTTTEAK